jgi:hypothetical protein
MFNNNYKEHPYFQYDYSLYPNREQQINFVKCYLRGFKEENEKRRRKSQYNLNAKNENTDIDRNNNKNEHENEVSQEDLEQLLKEANYFALASHLFWTFWSMCQASTCKIKFEYLVINYFVIILNLFFLNKIFL